MRLLIYGDIGGSGGYIRYCKGLLDSKMIPDGIQVWFVSSPSMYEKIAPLDPELNIIHHPWIISESRIQRYLWHLWVYPRIVRKIKPDIEFYPSGNLRVYLRKALTIATCHNLLLFDAKELERIEDKKERRYFNRSKKSQMRSFKKSNAVIFLSKHSQAVVCNEVKKIKRSTVIAHGLDEIFLQHKERSYEIGDSIKLLYVSPYYHYKHQMELVKAVQLLRKQTGQDICLNLIGGGNSSAAIELKEYLEKESIQDFVFANGNIKYEDLLKEYGSSDIFVFASSSETFGITLLEAMGARLPIACSNRTGLSDILKDAGVYFDPEDPESIAEAIKSLISNIELRRYLGEKGNNYAMEYTWGRCASETFNYIKKIGKEYGK